jgi:hypothetical protein
MQDIKKEYLKIYGYTPTDKEILNLYFQGQLILTDKQENEILNFSKTLTD